MAIFTLDELLALEHDGWDSLCDGTGGTYYGNLMTPDALMVLTNGIVMNREAVIASLNESPVWKSYEIVDPQVVALGDGASGLVYRAHAQREDVEPFVALMVSAYRTVAGKPKLAIYQQTAITH